MSKLLIGLVSYNDLHYLREVVPILDQLRKELNAEVSVLDTAHNDEVSDFFKKEFPKIDYFRHEEGNIGYGRGYSEILRAHPGFDYFLVCTNDVLLNEVVIKRALELMDREKEVALCCGKLYHWDFESGARTRIIDSFGIEAEKTASFS